MKLICYDGGFGRIEGETLVPMGGDLADYLAAGQAHDGAPRHLADVRLRAPVPTHSKIICIGLNYRDHAAESGMPIPERPVLFPKYANSLVGPGEPVVVPPEAEQIDYEAELGVVIGRRCSRVAAEDAERFVAGYVCANDVSSRSLQFATPQWMLGKAIDTFLPVGPWLVTADEVGDVQNLAISCTVNGERRQDSNTKEMIFGVRELVSSLSQTMTLEPGDLIVTGTPAGVGAGFDPPRFLSPGDVMRVEIEGLGVLQNEITAL